MYFKLLSYLGRFRKQAILAPLAVIGEVALEIYIPFLMARIIDIGIAQKNVPYIVETGLLMIAAAVVSLACGAAGARLAAVAPPVSPWKSERRCSEKFRIFLFQIPTGFQRRL